MGRYVEHDELETPAACTCLVQIAPFHYERCGKSAVVLQTTHVTANTWSCKPVCQEHKIERN